MTVVSATPLRTGIRCPMTGEGEGPHPTRNAGILHIPTVATKLALRTEPVETVTVLAVLWALPPPPREVIDSTPRYNGEA